MTPEERQNPRIINMRSRKKRIARGSGTSISEVNKVLKRYEEMRKMMRKMKGGVGLPVPKFPFKM